MYMYGVRKNLPLREHENCECLAATPVVIAETIVDHRVKRLKNSRLAAAFSPRLPH